MELISAIFQCAIFGQVDGVTFAGMARAVCLFMVAAWALGFGCAFFSLYHSIVDMIETHARRARFQREMRQWRRDSYDRMSGVRALEALAQGRR